MIVVGESEGGFVNDEKGKMKTPKAWKVPLNEHKIMLYKNNIQWNL
jgi:hypothetical protein